MLNVVSDYSVKRCDVKRQQKTDGAAVTRDGRLFYRRAAATGNALSPTVDRRVRRTSRDVDEAVSYMNSC